MTELSIIQQPVEQRAQQALKQAGVTNLERLKTELEAYSPLVNTIVTSKEEDAQVHQAYMSVRALRTETSKRGKEASEDARSFHKAVVAKVKQLTDVITPVELGLKESRDKYREEQKKIREAKRNRIRSIESAISDSRNIAVSVYDADAAGILTKLEELKLTPPTEESFQEFYSQAIEAHQFAIQTLTQLHESELKAEAEKAELEQLRAEKEAAEKAKIEAEKAKLDAERKAIELEKQRLAEEKAAKEKAEAEEAEKARLLALAPDKEKLKAAAMQISSAINEQQPDLSDPKAIELLEWLKSNSQKMLEAFNQQVEEL